MANDISTDDLLAFLNYAWNNAAAFANSLPDQLVIEQQNALQFIVGGSISNVGKNSTHQAYAGYGPGLLTQRQITSVYTRLLRDYRTLKCDIVRNAQENSVVIPDGFDFDAPIYDILTSAYDAISAADSNSRPDVTGLNLPAIGRCPGAILSW